MLIAASLLEAASWMRAIDARCTDNDYVEGSLSSVARTTGRLPGAPPPSRPRASSVVCERVHACSGGGAVVDARCAEVAGRRGRLGYVEYAYKAIERYGFTP